MRKSFLELAKEKIIVFDGAMGTQIQNKNLSLDVYENKDGCSEILNKTQPNVIKEIHESYFNVGCDVVETNSFGSSSIVLAEYDIPQSSYDLSFRSAKLAKEVALAYKNKYVAGSIGPTTKLPTLLHISYVEMKKSIYTQAEGLLDGGVDLFIVETCQDILQVKAALSAINDLMKLKGKKLPIICQLTIEQMGTMLVGTDIQAAYTALEPYDVDVIGMNCATGPLEMSDHIRHLCSVSSQMISCIPNAGIPENIGGKSHYHLTPEDLSKHLTHFVNDFGVNIIGGCCGTTPEHIKKLVVDSGNKSPKKRIASYINSVSSLYNSVPLSIDAPPILVGERTNANGSKLFRDLLAENDFEGMTTLAKEQLKEGAHILDVCTAYVSRDEIKDMEEYVKKLNTQVNIPLMIDSTEAPVIKKALEYISGKAIINSINLEDGEKRLEDICPLAKEFGSALVALTIDEDGMAKTVDSKINIAKRIYDLVTKKYGIKGENIIFDPLTFTLGSGDEEFRKSAEATLIAIKEIKNQLPGVKTILGVSNVSFGLNPQARKVLNSVFTHEAVKYGLDLAIVNAKKIIPLYKISDDEKNIALDLIYDRRKEGYDPLVSFMSLFEDIKQVSDTKEKNNQSVEDKLKNRIIDGDRTGLKEDLMEALKKYKALEIINNILLKGMKVVGDLFASGEMQLPFVLQSAETMKAAVSFLEPYMEKLETSTKGKMVIATVKGDVHDIGKNLVDIILTNNGYKIYNIGIKQPIENIINVALENNVDAIGMSGLLVKSTQIMKENLEILNERNISLPVILGGAALNRKFVEESCQPVYKGPVYYAGDAFDGLRLMEKIIKGEVDCLREKNVNEKLVVKIKEEKKSFSNKKSDFVKPTTVIPQPPFLGSKVLENISLDEVYPYINEIALMVGQWQFKKGKSLSNEQHRKLLKDKAYPILEKLKIEGKNILKPKVIYGYFNCYSEGNDLVILDENKKDEILRFPFPRQQDRDRLCISDFFLEKGNIDVVAFHIVTVGQEATEYAKKLFEKNEYTEYLYFHGFAVEVAEALAEWTHKIIRTELNIQQDDAKDIRKLLGQGYQGSRYSFGYPACPYLEDQVKLFELLKPERIGISLSESYQLDPEQSTNAIIVHHPQAKYFNVS